MNIENVKLVNLTKHEIAVFDDNGNKIMVIPPSGKQLRIDTKTEEMYKINGIPVYFTEFIVDEEQFKEFPEEENTYYIVSTVALQAMQYAGILRKDFIAPNTNPKFVVTDDKGRIVGVKAFQIL